MKKRKLLFLLVVVLCFSLILTACSNEEPEEPVIEEEAPAPEEEVETKHEMLNWFVLDTSKSEIFEKFNLYTGATQVEENISGEVPSLVGESFQYVVHEEIDKYNKLVKTLTVYKDGKAVITKTESVEYQGETTKNFTVDVTDDYVVVALTVNTGAESYTEYDIYKISDTSSVLYEKNDVLEYRKVGNALFVKTAETVEWVAENGKVIFSAPTNIYDSYWLDGGAGSDAEYNGYVYWYNSSRINVYSNGGASSVQYIRSAGANTMKVFILNDGNLLVQEYTYLDDYAVEYDTLYSGYKTLLETKIVNYKTGDVKTVEGINFRIVSLESDYNRGEYSRFPLALAEGVDNQAYIKGFNKVDENNYSDYSYVAISNSLEIQYTVAIKAINLDYETASYGGAYALTEKTYIAPLMIGSDIQYHIFDLDGNVLAALPEGIEYITSEYIITDSAIYDLTMQLVYSFDANKVFLGDVLGESIVVLKDSNFDGWEEFYFLNPQTAELTLIADEVNNVLCIGGDDYYVVAEYCQECLNHFKNCEDESCWKCNTSDNCCGDCKHTLYNCEGTALLTHRGHISVYEKYADAIIVEIEFEGKTVYYVVE